MPNLVLASQNDLPAAQLGAATSSVTFFRSMGGAVGVSALGAVLTSRITSLFAEKFGAGGAGAGEGKAPDIHSLPPEVLSVIRDIYGAATANFFLVCPPIAAVTVLVVLFINEKPLSILSGDERRAQEESAATGAPLH